MTTLETCTLQNNNSLKAKTIIETGEHKKLLNQKFFYT